MQKKKLQMGSLWALKIVQMSTKFEFAIYEMKQLSPCEILAR